MLAVVIPYYKITFFESTLQSLSNQTDKRFALYIGDDASPENPAFLLEKFKGKLDFVYHRFEKNLGSSFLTKQWEHCIDLVQNEKWLVVLGDDDVLQDNFVEEFYKNLVAIQNNKCSVIRFASQLIDENGNKVTGIFQHPILEKSLVFLRRKFEKKTRSSLSEYIFLKENLKFRDFPLAWFSDDMAIVESTNCGNIYSINSSCVEVRGSDKSISGVETNKKTKDIAKFYFFYNLQKYYRNKIDDSDKLFFNEKLINSFFNRIVLKNYFLLIFHYLTTLNFIFLLKLHYRLVFVLTNKVLK